MTNSAGFNKCHFDDAVLGDKIINKAPSSPLEKSIEKILNSIKDNPILDDIIEELAEYITDRPDREIIGVEEKLKRGEREDLLEDAVYLKNKFERKLAKKQMSLIEQKIYAHILSMINSLFSQKIRPLISEGQCKSKIDSCIQSEVIEPVYEAVVGFDNGITIDHVRGMLYFLTGKCHIVWSR